MSEEEKGAEPQEEVQDDRLRAALDEFEGAPAPEKIAGWKATYGDVYVAGLSPTEIFIFRSLNRKEYRKLQEVAQEQQLTSEDYEEEAVKTCLLWSSVTDLEAKAGTIPALLEMIMQNSNFVPPQLAAQLVAKL